MMLAVFYVHNVIPGPQLFSGQMDFVLALYMCLLLLSIIMVIFLFFIRHGRLFAPRRSPRQLSHR